MKRLFILVGFVLAGCQTGQVTETAGAARLSTPADFATLYGQRLTFGDSDFVTINANGTLSGNFSGVETLGTWEVRDGFWCRELSAGPRGPAPEDCQLFVRDGNALNITRERGNGASFVYMIS